MWLVDIDGTAALRRQGEGERHWSDWARVGEDLPNPAVITVIRALAAAGEQLVWLSARPEQCYGATKGWIHREVCAPYWRKTGEIRLCTAPLYLAPGGDGSGDSDAMIKSGIYVNQIVPAHGEADGVLEDRADVVRMWRQNHGLTVLSPAEGLF
jgi:hypothetical protein